MVATTKPPRRLSGAKSVKWSAAEREAWRIPPKLTVSQCADDDRVLTADSSSEHGRWRTSRTPFLRGPMDAFSDDEVEIVVEKKPVQSAGTESILNMIHYTDLQDPGPSLLVEPRDEDYRYVSAKRLIPMIEASPKMARHRTSRPWDLSKQEINLNNMTVYLAGSNSPAGLAMRPIRYLYLDEVNKFPPFAGKEANPIDLAIKRTTTFYYDRKIVIVSTATTSEGYISIWYLKSNMQQYYIPCPHCGELSVWKFAQLKCPRDLRDPDLIRRLDCVWYECELCKGRIEEYQKDELVAMGIWIAEGMKITLIGKKRANSKKDYIDVPVCINGDEQSGKYFVLNGFEYQITGTPLRDKRISGFNWSALISPWVIWPEIMAQWFEANTPEGIAIGKLMDFRNNIEGQDWIQRGKKAEEKDLKKIIGTFSKGTVPPGALILVAGADYHEDQRGVVRIDYAVKAFGYDCRNWTVQSGSVSSWKQYDEEVLLQPFPWADGTTNEVNPWLAVVCSLEDSGYQPDAVYGHCMQRPHLTIPTKGASGKPRTPITISKVELALRVSKKYRGQNLFIIDTEFFKDQVTSWMTETKDEDGKIIVPALTGFYNEVPDYYLREIGNEHKIKIRDGHGRVSWQWRPVTSGAQTHSLDVEVLCAAAGFFKKVHYMRDPNKKRAASAAVAVKRPAIKKKPIRGGFLDSLPKMLNR